MSIKLILKLPNLRSAARAAEPLRSERGLVSLIAVTIGSLVIAILAVGMVQMMTGELQQANDAESSVRAYYAAESGAEEAVLQVKHTLLQPNAPLSQLDQESCADNANWTSGGIPGGTNTSLTCRIVRTQGTDAIDSLPSNQAVQYDLSTVDFDTIKIQWDKQILPNPSLRASDVPPLEVEAITYDPTGATQPLLQVVYLYPVASGGVSTVDFGAVTRDTATANVTCNQTVAYKCSATLTDLWPPGGAGVIRLRSLEKNMNYEMTVIKSGSPVVFPLQSAEIDVTAQSSDSFRRITENVPIRSDPFAGLNNALYGDNSVCKDFSILSVGGNQTVYENACHVAESSNN